MWCRSIERSAAVVQGLLSKLPPLVCHARGAVCETKLRLHKLSSFQVRTAGSWARIDGERPRAVVVHATFPGDKSNLVPWDAAEALALGRALGWEIVGVESDTEDEADEEDDEAWLKDLATAQEPDSNDMERLVWRIVVRARSVACPGRGGHFAEAWLLTKEIFNELIDFNRFTPAMFVRGTVRTVREEIVVKVFERMLRFTRFGEVATRRAAPCLLGETEQMLCVDKPCGYDTASKNSWTDAISETMLLNADEDVQLVEYLALKYTFETAKGAREWWQGGEFAECSCGQCPECACTLSGCCNLIGKEASGIVLVAKTCEGYRALRSQLVADANSHAGLYFMALVHGSLHFPEEEVTGRCLRHYVRAGRGCIETNGLESSENGDMKLGGQGHQTKTTYEPVAWLSDKQGGQCTLLWCSGTERGILRHCSAIGHPLVGDGGVRDGVAERRVFLHAYQATFREPATQRWFRVTSPMPSDFGSLLASKAECVLLKRSAVLLSRDACNSLCAVRQHDPAEPLLLVQEPLPSNVLPDWRGGLLSVRPKSDRPQKKCRVETVQPQEVCTSRKLPEPWEKRESRTKPGIFYFWNPDTGETSVQRPAATQV